MKPNRSLTPTEQREWNEWLQLCNRIASETAAPIHETEKQQRKRINRLMHPSVECFAEFCQYYFPEYYQADFGWFHNKAIEDIIINKTRNNILEWPRETAKSVFADLFLSSYLLLSGWLDGLILASETEDKAKKLIKDIEAHLRHNKRIIHDHGDFGIIGTWLNGYFFTAKGIGFWAFGLGQNPSGAREGHRRPNLGIIDDADSLKKSKNETWAPETMRWIKGEFMGCLATKDRMFVYANNRVCGAGLTAHMVGDIEEGDPKNEGYNHNKAYWTEDPETKELLMPEDGGQPCWPENYNIDHCIARIEDMGYREAMRQLYHKELKAGTRFTEEMLPWTEVKELHKYDDLVTYCDPAFGESKKGCYRAIVLIGLTGSDYDIIWCWLRKGGNFAKAHYDLTERVANNSKVFYANDHAGLKLKINCAHWVEAGELQKVHLKRIYKELNETLPAPWYPRFDMEKKADKIGRIESLEPLAEHGHIRFNQAMKGSKDMQHLRNQFLDFPEGYIDGPDAVQGGINKLTRKNKSKNFKNRAGSYRKNLDRLG